MIQEKQTLTLDELYNEITGSNENTKWKLVREKDNLIKYSEKIMWLEWNEDNTFKEKHDYIKEGYSLMMSPFNREFTWQTTRVTKIIEEDESHIKFETQNSNYILYKL